MKYPLISVIVPIYKVEQFLPRCIDSLLNQTYNNLEIILVDDGSPDRCGEICEEYSCMDSRIKVIHKPNGGLSSARNAGLDIAQGSYIAFVDSDDWVDLDCYEKLFALIQKYGVKLAYAGRYDVDGITGKETVGLCPDKEEKISGEEMAARIFRWERMDSASWDKLYAAELFDGVRYPFGVHDEDVPVTYRLALRAEWCALGDFPVYHYYHRPGSITTSSFSDKAFFFPETALRIENEIAAQHPAILESARFLKVCALGTTVQKIDISTSQIRRQFRENSREYRRILRKNILFILRCSIFSSAQRRDFLLISINLYRCTRRVYHFLKELHS